MDYKSQLPPGAWPHRILWGSMIPPNFYDMQLNKVECDSIWTRMYN